MRRLTRAIGIFAALGGCQALDRHAGVEPWDVPDAVNPDHGAPAAAPRMGDPSNLVQAEANTARLADGATVELVSVARSLTPSYPEPLPDARPAWTPDGSPDLGPTRYANQAYLRPAAALEGQGARWLVFRVTAPTPALAENATVTGYVPDGARQGTPDPERHGWDIVDRSFWMPRDGSGQYTTCVVVDDRRASHYRLALARGEWKVAASAPIVATDEDAALLARGPWGTLRRVPPKHDPPGAYSAKRTPQVAYVVDPPTDRAPAFATEVRILDAEGRKNARVGRWAAFRTRPYPTGPAVRVEVAARPYEWVEFSGVHYDPDPAKWPKAYWGDEGAGTIARADGVALEAIVRPGPGTYPGSWEPRAVYAPDGRLWRNHPDPGAIQPTFSGPSGSGENLVAALQFDEGRVTEDTPARVEGYAADGATPGKGLRGPLQPPRSWPMTRSQGQYPFAWPDAPFVQFAVRYGSDRWTKAGEIAVPRIVFPLVEPKERASYARGSVLYTMFSVIRRSTGEAGLYWHTRTANPDALGYDRRDAFARWPKDGEARVVARLHSGRRVVLPNNSAGSSGDGSTSQNVDFDQDVDSDPVYDTTGNDPRHGVRLKLSGIAAFEIETRGFSEPVYVAAKLPPR